jgi:NAD(P)-dependent dehydrogenase (short-subunit alcohol dehydrogenase family)
MSLRQKRVVVVGGTSGIGFAVAQGAAAEGASVVLGSSRQESIDAARAKLMGAAAHVIDVKDEASVAAFFEKAGAFDHLVFTAGDWGSFFGAPKPIDDLDIDAAKAGMAVRFWGALACIKHGRKHMRDGGSIVLTDGTVAHRPRKGHPVSTAAAGAIEHLVHGLAVDLAPAIRVNGVCPAGVRTEAWNDIPEAGRETAFKRMTERQPLPRIGEASEVAEAYLYLMKGGYTTGQVLRVDGGATRV